MTTINGNLNTFPSALDDWAYAGKENRKASPHDVLELYNANLTPDMDMYPLQMCHQSLKVINIVTHTDLITTCGIFQWTYYRR